jgi:cytochrome c oxidase subunit 1
MGIIGVGMSLLFRMQLVWPEESFRFLTYYLVISGRQTVTNDTLFIVGVHDTRYHNGLFVLTAALKWSLVTY